MSNRRISPAEAHASAGKFHDLSFAGVNTAKYGIIFNKLFKITPRLKKYENHFDSQ